MDVANSRWFTESVGLNDAGTVVGSFIQASTQHGFRFRNGVYQVVDYPGNNSINVAWGG
jgi:hypothetical protein